MPILLTKLAEWGTRLEADFDVALKPQRLLPTKLLQTMVTGERRTPSDVGLNQDPGL